MSSIVTAYNSDYHWILDPLVINPQLHFGNFLCSDLQILAIDGGSGPLPVNCGVLDIVALDTVFCQLDRNSL